MQEIKGNLKAAGQSITEAGYAMSAAFTAPIAGAGAAILKFGGDFESSMTRVAVLGDITGEAFDALKTQAVELGLETSFSANQAADGMGEMAAAGFKANEIAEAMPGVLGLAAAGQTDVATVSQVTSDILKGFAMQAKDASMVADVLAKSSADSSAGVVDLGNAFKYVGPVAQAMGVEFKEVSASLMIMADAGIRGEKAGTGLAQSGAGGSQARQLSVATTARKGDFDAMLERRAIRFYVPYSRSLYFIDKGRERGIAADLIREFERWVNRKHAKSLGKRPLTVFVVVATRDKLHDDLLAGHGDVAVGNIKVLDEFLKTVDFVAPVDNLATTELLVTGPASPALATIDDLAGKTVHMREYSAYYLSLKALNERFRKAGKPEAKLVYVPNALEDEDMLEMLNAGLVEAIVVEDWKARMWAQVLTKVKVHEDIPLRPRTKLGWAIRKASPKLVAELNEFHAYYAKQQGGIPRLQRQYMGTIQALKSATASSDYKRYVELVEVFRKYGKQYNFDPLMLAAQGYQESTLNQEAQSRNRIAARDGWTPRAVTAAFGVAFSCSAIG